MDINRGRRVPTGKEYMVVTGTQSNIESTLNEVAEDEWKPIGFSYTQQGNHMAAAVLLERDIR